MLPVMTRCPTTGANVWTLHRLSAEAFHKLEGSRYFRCPQCSQPHAWDRTSAWLVARAPADDRYVKSRTPYLFKKDRAIQPEDAPGADHAP